MFAYLEGRLESLTPTFAIVDAGGVGYHLNISLTTFEQLQGKPRARLWAHLIVKEDEQTLYGFAGDEERTVFRHLITVAGVGPNTARMLLSSMGPQELRRAIISGNTALLRGAKGIGLKTAERIVIELKDKMAKEGGISAVDHSPRAPHSDEAISALVTLGFPRMGAEKAVGAALAKAPNGSALEDIIKLALKSL